MIIFLRWHSLSPTNELSEVRQDEQEEHESNNKYDNREETSCNLGQYC